MKKYALLILGHTDPSHMRRLIYSLDYEHFDIYVHIDKRQDISKFHFERYILNFSKLFVITDRIPVYWGDISIVYATLEMYRAAMRQMRYERFITLSGLDYPIKSNKDIFQILSDSQKEYIMGNPFEESDLHKVECFYCMKKRIINKIINRVTTTLYRNTRISFGASNLTLSTGERWEFYFAPQWHALSYEFVEYMFQCLDNHPEILERFEHVYAPDEIAIPTILFNSKFKDRAIQSDFPPRTHYNQKTAIHYLNYGPVIEVFDENSFDSIVNSGKCFARKLCSNKSDTLIKMLDAYRKNTGNNQYVM